MPEKYLLFINSIRTRSISRSYCVYTTERLTMEEQRFRKFYKKTRLILAFRPARLSECPSRSFCLRDRKYRGSGGRTKQHRTTFHSGGETRSIAAAAAAVERNNIERRSTPGGRDTKYRGSGRRKKQHPNAFSCGGRWISGRAPDG